MKKINLIPIIVSIALVLGIVRLLMAQQLVLAGERLHYLSGEAARLEQENGGLWQKIVDSGGLRKIQRRAEEMGMVKAKALIYVRGQVPMAWKP